MYKFTSPQTHIKLKQHKIFQIPDFDYSSLLEIETKYQNLCQQSRKELFSAQKRPSNLSVKIVSEDREKHYSSKEDENTSNKSTKLNYLKDRVLDFYKNQKKVSSHLGLVNPVVKMFGNAVIAAIFHSLIIKTAEDVFEIHVDDPLTFSNQ